MFKRIASMFSGASPAPPAAQPPAPTPAPPALIKAWDKFGREISITRAEWLDKVLQPNLHKHWDDAGELYGLIISALNDGFAAQLLDASARLLELDRKLMPERGFATRGIVLMANKQLDEAEAVLKEGIAQVGDTATLLVNLAKVQSFRGDEASAAKLLWAGVQRDPNLDNALTWWLAIQNDTGGKAAYVQALLRACALPGSWRPQLWLARERLAAGNLPEALALYRQVLDGGLYESSALMMISGDLGNHGHAAVVPQLIGKLFVPGRHDPVAGLNLLQAYLQLKNVTQGEALLRAMYQLEMAPYKQHLDGYADAFLKLRAESDVPAEIDMEALQIETITLGQPVWCYGLEDPAWLLTPKEAKAPVIAFFALSNLSGASRAEQQREDDAGRLTRAVALYWAEAVHYWTDFAGQAWFNMVKGGGPVVYGAEMDGAQVAGMLPQQVTHFVTGSIAAGAQEVRLNFQLWDREKKLRLATESVAVKPGVVGSAVLVLEKRLLAHLGRARAQPLDAFYVRPSAESIAPYLVELGQSFMLSAVANGYGTRERLWGERNLLEWPLNMALRWSQAETPRIMYLSGLAKAFQYQSQVLPEFRQRTLQFMRDAAQGKSPAARLQPLVWKIFGMHAELQALARNVDGQGDAAYARWVKALLKS
ncbi:MAG: tetratricopeptide repeat protein [Burkholderiales bacterium]|nr:tetratricopeptide repeat protein [Burkholderiales bacterium]